MIHEVHYSRNVQAAAMSKRINQAGIHIETDSWYADHGKNILLHSINAKGGQVTTHLHLQIPKEDLANVIEALKRFL